MEPGLTGLAPFLSVDAPGSSGVLIAEYLAADALARLRGRRGAGRARQASRSRAGWRSTRASPGRPRCRRGTRSGTCAAVLALEWVVAERALRMKGAPDGGVLAPVRALASGFDRRLEDRPIGADAALAEAALPALARAVRAAAG